MTDFSLPLERSLKLQEEAKRRIPGMTQLLSKRPDRFSYGVWPGYYKKAKGVEIWDLDGNRYTDMSIGGIGANVLGYADPDVDEAVMEAIKGGSSCSLNCPEEIELANLLCELHPWAEMVRYARTGGEAVAIALRIARTYTGREKVAVCGYHGWHDWYLAANLGTKNSLGQIFISGLSPAGVPKALAGTAFPFVYNHLDDLKSIVKTHKNELAAIIMEPVRDEYPVPGFLEGVRALADEIGAVFIIDEISAGFRLTTGGAHLVIGNVVPDIAVFSKALGNGYPIAAIIGNAAVMQAAQKTFISSTNWTERIGPTAALATIRKHKRMDVGNHLMTVGRMVQDGWRTLSEKHKLELNISGIPPLGHFVFNGEQSAYVYALYVQLMLEKGFLASSLFYAMYAHSKEHVRQYLEAADSSFGKISEAIKGDRLKQMLRGKPSVKGFKRLA